MSSDLISRCRVQRDKIVRTHGYAVSMMGMDTPSVTDPFDMACGSLDRALRHAGANLPELDLSSPGEIRAEEGDDILADDRSRRTWRGLCARVRVFLEAIDGMAPEMADVPAEVGVDIDVEDGTDAGPPVVVERIVEVPVEKPVADPAQAARIAELEARVAQAEAEREALLRDQKVVPEAIAALMREGETVADTRERLFPEWNNLRNADAGGFLVEGHSAVSQAARIRELSLLFYQAGS